MAETILNEQPALYVLAESNTDRAIIRTLLDCDKYRVYAPEISGFANMATLARTLRLMIKSNDKILIAFDAETMKKDSADEKIARMRFLSKADASNNIGVFCFLPQIESIFPANTRFNKENIEELKSILKTNLETIKQNTIIKQMQMFVNGEE
ncbi:MAG: hypothetical protein MJZ72_07430 [Bacteroidales bacterium]|nr:hypothetical protein [Bacteroidales bacterium]